MFIARRKELEKTRAFLAGEDTAMLIYGKRRVGKTRLIKEALSDTPFPAVFYQCTSESYETNLRYFTKEIEAAMSLSYLSFSSFDEAFSFLMSQKRRIAIVLDEYGEFKKSYGPEKTDSMMQRIIDTAKGSLLKIIISGSAVSLMKELLEEQNPLFDRFGSILHLYEFDYYDASLFFPNLTSRDKAAYYAVFGGSPNVLESIDTSASLETNIEKLLLAPDGKVRSFIERSLLQEYGRIGPALTLFETLGNGKKTYRELREMIDPHNTGNLSKLLKKLIDNEAVECVHPINRPDDRKTAFYTIRDNLLRFYFTYVHPNRSRIQQFGVDAVFEQFVEPSLSTYLSYRFEDIARSYFQRAVRAGLLKGVLDVGTYWYDDAKRHRNGEFDCAVSYADGYDIIEVKHLAAPMDRLLADEEIRKIRGIDSLKVRRIGFVSIEGFSFADPCCILISGADLFAPELELPASRKRLE